ncbi:hypothetical protein M5689_012243 [Euphorbia peplus]|nr:hypothetical protein M5689_012243 [Euphorbia peplus]
MTTPATENPANEVLPVTELAPATPVDPVTPTAPATSSENQMTIPATEDPANEDLPATELAPATNPVTHAPATEYQISVATVNVKICILCGKPKDVKICMHCKFKICMHCKFKICECNHLKHENSCRTTQKKALTRNKFENNKGARKTKYAT